MSKRFMYLISFVLVFALSGAVQAGTAIDINNPSFEYEVEDGNVVRVDCHMGLGASPDVGVLGWIEGYDGQPDESRWCGVDVDCSDPCACDDCDAWHDLPDGNVVCYIINDGSYVYQVLDVNFTQGYQYTLKWDGLAWGLDTKASFFYPEDANFPDSNHVEVGSTSVVINSEELSPDYWGFEEDLTFKWVCEGAAPDGRKIGIKFNGTAPFSGSYVWVDNVRLEWDYATYAYEPIPADKATDVSKTQILKWKSGSHTQATNGHLVFFGTSYAEVYDANTLDSEYKGAQNRDANSYNPGTLELGGNYFWRIDEVNSAHTTPPPPVGPWKGDVWRFQVTGYATNPSPADGASGVPFLKLLLEWTAGTEATSHDVYFSTDYDDANDADTSTTGIYRGIETDPNYFVPESNEASGGLDVGETYYWRVDERSASKVLKGNMWEFTIGAFLVVDDFDGYANQNELWAVWDDYWVNYSGAQIYPETDWQLARDGNSLRFTYDNSTSYKTSGSYIDAQDPAELDAGSDWTAGGVKSLTLYFLGDPCNVVDAKYLNRDRMWLEIEDTGSNVGFARHPDVNKMTSANWTEWRHNLFSDFNDACGVDLANLDRFTIGVGGAKVGQSTAAKTIDQIRLEDIRLYPPRCLPEYGLSSAADITGDCFVDYEDVNVMATDWLIKDSFLSWGRNKPAILTGFPDATSHWDSNAPVGTGSIVVDDGYHIEVNDPCLYGLATMSLTCWIKQSTSNEWVGLICSREATCNCGDDASMMGIFGSAWDGADGLGYDWSGGTEEWQWDSGLGYPSSDGTWTFCAVAIDPTGATVYMKKQGGSLQAGSRNTVVHAINKNWADHFVIGNNDKEEPAYFVGNIDDVRVYDWALSFNDMNDLATKVADPNPWPVYRYEFDETTGYTAANSGTCSAYLAPASSANIADPESLGSRIVNFNDYEALADDWLQEFLWPPE